MVPHRGRRWRPAITESASRPPPRQSPASADAAEAGR